MIEARTPDGAVHQFPDGTPPTVIDGAIKDYLSSQPKQGAGEYGFAAAPPEVKEAPIDPATGMAAGGYDPANPASEPQKPEDLKPVLNIPTTIAGVREAIAPPAGYVPGTALFPFATKEVSPGQGDPSAGTKFDPPALFGLRNALGVGLELMGRTGLSDEGETGNPLRPFSPEATTGLLMTALGRTAPDVPGVLSGGAGAVPELAPSSLVRREAPVDLPPNPLGPIAQAKIAATPQGQLVPAERPLPAVPREAIPGAQPEAATPTGVVPSPGTAPIKATTPEDYQPAIDAAKQVATAHYDNARAAGAQPTAQFTNSLIDSVEKALPPEGIERSALGPTATSQLLSRLEPYRDQPMTLSNAFGIDKIMGDLITGEYDPIKGISPEGRKLQQVQRDFRDRIANPDAGDMTGSTAGLDSYAQARQAYSAAMRLEDLQRIQQRANRMAVPSTSIINQVGQLLENANKRRGYSEDEIAALKDAQSRGTLGTAFHVFGSRLMPLAIATAGLEHSGMLGMMLGGGLSHLGGETIRGMATNLQAKRLSNVGDIIQRSVPIMPSNALGP